jgi:hypothetical protein
MKKFLSEIKYDAEFIRGHTLQPQWYKILKVFLLLGLLGGYFALFGGWKTLVFCVVFFGLSTALHLVYRIKTQKFTQSWLDFIIIEDDQGQRSYQRIGIYYYLAVSTFLILAIILSQILL